METSSQQAAAREAPAVGPIRLADGLGWASLALGAPMTAAPRRGLRAIGVEDDREALAWTIGVGAREHLATVTINLARHRRVGMWSRVAGDSMDLTLLARAYRSKRSDGDRLRAAMAIVGGLLLLDLATAVALTRAEGGHIRDAARSGGTGADHDTGGGPLRVRTAVTIRKPEEEVRRAFREFGWTAFDAAALEAAGDVRFAPAPRDRGTEVHVDHDPEVRGGAVGATAARLSGQAPDQRVNDELRRFKAVLETGVVTRSDTNPDGFSSARQILHKGRPAQPVEATA